MRLPRRGCTASRPERSARAPPWILTAFRHDFFLILPEVELVLFGLAILLFDFMLGVRDKTGNAVFAMLGVIFSGISLYRLRGAVAAMPSGGFNSSIVVDPFFLFFGMIFLIATALVILLSVRYLQIEHENHGEYYALLLFATVGMMFMASGYDLIVQFLGLETMALSFYVLTGFLRHQRRSNEGAVKYLLLGAFSSGLLAYGFSLLYGIGAMADLSGPLGDCRCKCRAPIWTWCARRWRCAARRTCW